ncbi:hypothetical protein SASPL_157965 [Salvia splendens]|uniref:Uncharacterized protein n=1 Tax=Salvia splendens TaxID=180675 RepID=A0A8X8VU16_SALSN|nr:hypothetical protein SASPL_157965 [Salvia splendens]
MGTLAPAVFVFATTKTTSPHRRGPPHGNKHGRPDPARVDVPDVVPRAGFVRHALLPQPVLRLPHRAPHHNPDHGPGGVPPHRPLLGRGAARDEVRAARFGPRRFSLNPGPFNIKEHVLISIFANAGARSGAGIWMGRAFEKYVIEPAHMWCPEL